jgi:hypothetical protein
MLVSLHTDGSIFVNVASADQHLLRTICLGHDMALKIIKTKSQEYSVARFLYEKRDELCRPTGFTGVIPIVDLIRIDDEFHIVVMPRWFYSYEKVHLLLIFD